MSSRALPALLIALLAWGVFAFGAVYDWAFVPLASAAAIAGVWGVVAAPDLAPRPLLLACGLVAAGIALQLAPLPVAVIESISPTTGEALRQLDPVYAVGISASHPISILPPSTARALALFAAWGLLLGGATSLFSRIGAERFAGYLVILAVAVAFAGIIQKSFLTPKIYGVWTSVQGGTPFGPFVNRNHYAGWMLMALPLTLGLFCAGVARGMRGVKPELRERLLWLASADASKIVMQALAASVMLLALVLTFSRSGFIAASLTILVTGLAFLRSSAPPMRKVIVAGFLVVMTTGVIGWVGPDAIGRRFTQGDTSELGARPGAWADAWSVAKRFPLAGTGINTYGTSMLLYQSNYTDKHFSSAHNDYLQVAAEGGLLVAVPVLIALGVLVALIRRRLREDRGSSYYWLRAGAVVSLVAIGLQEVVDFSLQMPGNAAMFAVICAIAIHKRPPRPAAGERRPAPDIVTSPR